MKSKLSQKHKYSEINLTTTRNKRYNKNQLHSNLSRKVEGSGPVKPWQPDVSRCQIQQVTLTDKARESGKFTFP
ncbi:hypothetical protein HDI48_000851 [Listeria monocytogenes]|nr:hypothetical protein [Listeria monocytogenes]EHH9515158.1 hypothetical protein [Listeria monocytogenes]